MDVMGEPVEQRTSEPLRTKHAGPFVERQDATEKTPPPQRLKRIFTDDRRESMQYLQELRKVIDEFPDRVLAGEVQGKTDRIGHFYGEGANSRFHLPLNFALLDTPWDALSLQANIDAYLNAIPDDAWPDWVIGGHDKKRIASKVGSAQARIVAMLLLTLKGTPFLFAGDELGMEHVPIPPERIRDPFEKLVPGYGLNRDPERAPMRWDASPNAGFTTGEPWLPISDNSRRCNVATLMSEPHSLPRLYKRLIELRRREPALTIGDYRPLRSRNDVLLYKRALGRTEIVVALNTRHEPRKLEWQGSGLQLLSTYLDNEGAPRDGPLLLRPDEGLLLKIET